MDIADFQTYQRESRKTWNEIPMNHTIVYPTMGLLNEAGEVAGKVKKIFRDRGGEISEEDRQRIDGVIEPGRAVVSYYEADFGPYKYRW